MKKNVTKKDLVDKIKRFDTRLKKLTDEEYDEIIDDSFAELSSNNIIFSNENIEYLSTRYEFGETKYSVTIDRNVLFIYDCYLTYQENDREIKVRKEENIKVDDIDQSRVNIDLTSNYQEKIFEKSVIRFIYFPSSSDEEYLLDQDVYSILKIALKISSMLYVNDTARSEEARLIFSQKFQRIANKYPRDYTEPEKKSIFPL